MDLKVKLDPKGLRETLCVAQSMMDLLPMNVNMNTYVKHLQALINECDRHRPLGPDGKHGNRHTETCGCEDKGHGFWCGEDFVYVINGPCRVCNTFVSRNAPKNMSI